ncbi:MAG TPA: cytochrome bc complex cytochrome b subunit [Deltaproteobacteria bacterium]|nr:cytochrome bc complex cytochrome b subunit [Deltaproteobacteria bacterium]
MKSGTSKRLLWSWTPESLREADDAIVKNLWLHWFPGTVTRRSISFTYSFWLGTISAVLFAILTITGIVLMFHYTPSMERAYTSMKDINYAISYGWFFRSMHRVAAQLMVVTVLLHMMRVFYTRAYKRSPGNLGNRPFNWIIGIFLLILTLALSYTGYLLPMDQLAYWAMMIGTSVAGSVPVIGGYVQTVLTGGTEIGQNALLRFYVLHCVVLPFATVVFVAYHMWRIRKDGGLACMDQIVLRKKKDTASPASTKTYSLLGIARGVDVSVKTSSHLEEEDLIKSTPNVMRRVWLVTLLTLIVTIALSIYFKFPLEAPADPAMAPNPAKAPWYFLWLQELIADTTFTLFGITFNGAFLGGVVIPSIVLIWLAAVPYLDRGSTRSNGIWFPRERLRQNLIFTLVVLVILALIFIGAFCRGPDWIFYWPWEQWPVAPIKF